MKKIMHWLAPKKNIFDMHAGQSANVLVLAKELKSFVDDYSNFDRSERKAKIQYVKGLKEQSDKLHYEIVLRLERIGIANKSIAYGIALLLREATDLLADSSSKFMVLGIERIDGHILKLINALCSSAEELNSILGAKKLEDAVLHYKKLQSLKDDADEIRNEALSELFHFYKNSIDIMKYREIYGLLTDFIEKCRNAAELAYILYAKR